MKNVIYLVLGLILFICISLIYMANPWGSNDAVIHNGDASLQTNHSDTIRVLTFNMAYAYGVGSDGVGYVPKSKEQIFARLQNIALLLNDYKVDIALLQEVDFDADRSGNKNQAGYLAELSSLKNYATAVSWNANYVPFPYSPISHQFGKVNSGGAVLSRFPIQSQTVHLLEKPKANAWWYNLFYLHRYIQHVTLSVSGIPFSLLNMHLEAYDIQNKEEQAKKVESIISNDKSIRLFGGDMNSLPPFATQMNDFDDDYGDDYRNDKTQTILRGIQGFSEPKEAVDDSRFYTFPPLKPNRQLDYIFVNSSFKVIGYEVIDTGDLSDHRPILLTLKLRRDE